MATTQTCLPSCLQKIQTIFSVLTVAATLLLRWLRGTFPSVRPSRSALHPQGSIAVEQTTAETSVVQKALLLFSRKRENLMLTQKQRKLATSPRSVCRAEISEERPTAKQQGAKRKPGLPTKLPPRAGVPYVIA